MAKQTSVFQLQGTVGNVSFYKQNGEYFVRRKSSVSKSRIKNDPAYALTRKNMAEFKRAAEAGKLFRRAFWSLVRIAGGKRISNRLVKTMMQVIQADDVNNRGERTVKDGQPQLLDGFEFNETCSVFKRFRAPLNTSVHPGEGLMTVAIEAFSAANDISAPKGATHFRLLSGGAAIDFENASYVIGNSESDYLPVRQEWVGPIELIQSVGPNSEGVLFLVFGIEFSQLINGEQTPIMNVGVNAMAVVAVSPPAK